MFWAYQGEVDARDLESRSDQNYHSAWLILSGWAEVNCRGREHRAEQGEALLVPPGRRRQRFAGQHRVVSVRFEAAWPDGSSLLGHKEPRILRGPEVALLLQRALDLVVVLAQTHSAEVWQHWVAALSGEQYLDIAIRQFAWMRTLMDVFARQAWPIHVTETLDERVQAALDHLQAQPVGVRVTLPALGRAAGLSPSQLERLFVRDLGCTPRQYQDRLVLAKARDVLAHTDWSIRRIALDLHFQDPPKFVRWFKRQTNLTPLAYRNRSSGAL